MVASVPVWDGRSSASALEELIELMSQLKLVPALIELGRQPRFSHGGDGGWIRGQVSTR
jgi:hypothetical protein